jgi:hypothetical protein
METASIEAAECGFGSTSGIVCDTVTPKRDVSENAAGSEQANLFARLTQFENLSTQIGTILPRFEDPDLEADDQRRYLPVAKNPLQPP